MVGESPWNDEVREGKNFAGAAGAMLERCLRRLGMERQQLVVANAVWCKSRYLGFFDRPQPLADQVMSHCRPHLDSLIESREPRVIVTLGAVAMNRVLGVTGLAEHHGYVHDSVYGVPVVPTYHPSYIMQGQQRFQAVLMFALRRAQEVASGNWRRSPVSYVLDDYEALGDYLVVSWTGSEWTREHPVLAVDIETPKSSKLDEEKRDEEDDSYTIIRASMSHTPGTAVTFPWVEPFIGLAKRTAQLAKVVVMHNSSYDRPRLEAQGWKFGEVHDSMWAWHFLQSDLPKALGFVAPFYYDGPAWKHLSDAQPAWYSAVDADATLRVYRGVKADLEKQGRWQRWLRHYVEAGNQFRRMGARGVLLDRERQAAFRAKLEAEYEASYKKLQGEVPRQVMPRKVYKTGKQGGVEVQVPCDCQTKGKL